MIAFACRIYINFCKNELSKDTGLIFLFFFYKMYGRLRQITNFLSILYLEIHIHLLYTQIIHVSEIIIHMGYIIV